ncbi:energy-coupling factor transporter transmembrane component T family protein [Phascolarctobacterium sp.]|uniref:energy-coupling factor transporter transmembrane component T family protein n=2 Tax=Phascolarctobacterium sp. TaxID=2049039 RepID=UPI00386F40D6
MLTDITLGQYFPGNSLIHRLDPRTKILATFIYIVAIFFADTPLSYGILSAFAAVVIMISRLPWLLVLKSLKPIWIIVIITMLIHMFTAPGEHIVFAWKYFSVTQEGLDLGMKMAVRLVLLLLFSSVLTFTTSPIVLTDGIENLLRPFKCVGVPAHELAMMMTIALRFIPTLLEETDRIMKAQTARGADFGSGNMVERMKNMLPLLVPLFISAFRRAEELAIAMEARCYRGGEGRTRMHELSFTGKDYVSLILVILLAVGLAVLRWGKLCGL